MQHLVKRMGAALVAAAALAVTGAQAQTKPADYPQRPIEMVVVYPAGGGVDITARILAQESERILGHQFRVQNRVGGGGITGHTYLAKAPADGYTLGVVANPFLLLDFMMREGQFDQNDFDPLVGINFSPVAWVVRTDSPLGKMDFNGVITEAKKKPGAIKIGVIPNNTFEYVTEFVEKSKGVKFAHVPFQGGKPGVTALLGGHIDLTNAFYEEVEQYVRAGTLRVIAVSDSKRFSKLPDVPAMTEVGVPLAGGTWGAARLIVTPKGTSPEIRKYLEASFLKVLKDPKTVEAYNKVGATVDATDTATTKRVYGEAVNAMQSFLKESGRKK